jgi:hypothetical protein
LVAVVEVTRLVRWNAATNPTVNTDTPPAQLRLALQRTMVVVAFV